MLMRGEGKGRKEGGKNFLTEPVKAGALREPQRQKWGETSRRICGSHFQRCGNYAKSRMKGANRHLLKGQIDFIARDRRVTAAARNLEVSDIRISPQNL